MTDPSQPTRVVAVGDFRQTLQQITTALGSQPEFELVDVIAATDKMARRIQAVDAEILLVDHMLEDQSTLDVIDDLVLQFPDLAVITVLPNEDPLRAQQVMLAGARAFLIMPFTQVNLLSTLRRVRDLEARRVRSQNVPALSEPGRPSPLRTIAVFSPRGGVGCSTVAVNLALTMHEQSGARVLLMDGKLAFGHLDLMLNIRTRNTLADLVPHAAALDDGLVKDVVVEHAAGVHVLLGPGNVQVAQGIRPEDLYNIVTGIQARYDFVVIDTGSTLSDNTVTIMDTADRILVITTPDLAALHDASQFIQIGRTLSYPPEKILIVLNRADMAGGVKRRDIEAALHHELFADIPDDAPNSLRSINRGMPLVMRYPRSSASRGIRSMAEKIQRVAQGEGVVESEGTSRPKGLLSRVAST